jgi:hypothetical protein
VSACLWGLLLAVTVIEIQILQTLLWFLASPLVFFSN